MKKIQVFIFLIALLAFTSSTFSQGIGELAPDKEPEVFPDNAFGLDLMFSDGGFGLGTFYRRQISPSFTLFTDFSVSEAKDEREFEYYDYWGNPITVGKKNRVFILPLNFGVQYRLFRDVISDNLRPYVNIGVGPAVTLTTPYEMEFFDSFGSAKAKYTVGGYIGLGANFGLDKSSLVGLSVRYYVIHFFDQGVESLYNKYKQNLGGFFLTINIGMMY